MKKIIIKISNLLKKFLFQIFNYPSILNISTNYDKYWIKKNNINTGKINSFQLKRTKWIINKIKNGASLIDIGSGNGNVLLYINSQRNINSIAADISDYSLNLLKNKGIKTIKFDINDFSSIDNLPEVDHIILFEILEHMQNPEQFLKLIEKKVKISIFFSFPNTGYFIYRLRLLFGKFPVQWRIHPGEHLRFWTYKDLLWWLSELDYLNRTEFICYEGIPILNKLFGSLFGMAFVGEIKCLKNKNNL